VSLVGDKLLEDEGEDKVLLRVPRVEVLREGDGPEEEDLDP
jgi:hypothetical protein